MEHPIVVEVNKVHERLQMVIKQYNVAIICQRHVRRTHTTPAWKHHYQPAWYLIDNWGSRGLHHTQISPSSRNNWYRYSSKHATFYQTCGVYLQRLRARVKGCTLRCGINRGTLMHLLFPHPMHWPVEYVSRTFGIECGCDLSQYRFCYHRHFYPDTAYSRPRRHVTVELPNHLHTIPLLLSFECIHIQVSDIFIILLIIWHWPVNINVYLKLQVIPIFLVVFMDVSPLDMCCACRLAIPYSIPGGNTNGLEFT